MSYNVTRWKTKELDGFEIELEAIMVLVEAKSYTRLRQTKDGLVFSGLAEVSKIAGTEKDGYLVVSSVEFYGEGSGGSGWKILLDLFKHSRGYLYAVQVWEGGDSVSRLIVRDGQISEQEIEL